MLRPALLLLLLALPAAAETWRVGPGEALRLPSEAAARAGAGDTVLLASGTYADCAVWRAPGLTIAAMEGAAPVITGPVCEEKGLFVMAAPGR